jgi:hypothetical protein
MVTGHAARWLLLVYKVPRRPPSACHSWWAGGLKAVYDLTIFAAFRGVRPPEEAGAAASGAPGPAVHSKA